MNKQGNTLQHYIDVLKWAKTGLNEAGLLSIASLCYADNLYTSECIDRCKKMFVA